MAERSRPASGAKMRRELLRTLERFLLPNACVCCERLIGGSQPDALVCGVCRSRLTSVVGGCRRCRQPLPPVGPCRFCAWWPPSLRWARSAVWLGDQASRIVHHLKYEGYTALGAEMARIVARAVPHPGSALLVPLPLAGRRLRQRGYNQSDTVATALASQWKLPVVDAILRRVRDTPSQTALDPAARRANVAGAFSAKSAPTDVDAAASETAPAVILVDDVLTTGATLAAAATALAVAGWPDMGAVTFARALPFDATITASTTPPRGLARVLARA